MPHTVTADTSRLNMHISSSLIRANTSSRLGSPSFLPNTAETRPVLVRRTAFLLCSLLIAAAKAATAINDTRVSSMRVEIRTAAIQATFMPAVLPFSIYAALVSASVSRFSDIMVWPFSAIRQTAYLVPVSTLRTFKGQFPVAYVARHPLWVSP